MFTQVVENRWFKPSAIAIEGLCFVSCILPILVQALAGTLTFFSFAMPWFEWWHVHMHPWEPLMYTVVGAMIAAVWFVRITAWRRAGFFRRCRETGALHFPSWREWRISLALLALFLIGVGIQIGHRYSLAQVDKQYPPMRERIIDLRAQ